MKALALIVVVSLAACQSRGDVNAVLVDPSEQSHAAVQTAIAGALGASSLRLAAGAFTSNSLVTIERPQRRGIGVQNPNGLVLGKPEQFRLVQSESDCVLVRLSDGTRHALENVSCRPASP